MCFWCADTLTPSHPRTQPHKHTHTHFSHAIPHRRRLAASSSGRLLAAADVGGCVLLLALVQYKGTAHLKWECVGRVKAHLGEVRALG